MIPQRLTPILGSTLSGIDEGHLNALVAAGIREDQDLDYKENRYQDKDSGTSEIAKDVAAMANQVGGLIIIGIKEDTQARADSLTPIKVDDKERSRIHGAVADRVRPSVAGLSVEIVETAAKDGTGYYVISVPHSASAPHATLREAKEAPWLAYPQRNGAMTTYLSEAQIAARYRDRFELARSQIDKLERLDRDALRPHNRVPATLAVGIVPWLRGNRPLSGNGLTVGTYVRDLVTSSEIPRMSGLDTRYSIARGRQRFYSPDLAFELHTDGSAWAESWIGSEPSGTRPRVVDRDEFESIAVELAAIAGRYTAWSGAGGDCAVGFWLNTGAGGFMIFKKLVPSLTTYAAETTASVETLGGSLEKIGEVVYPLVRDLSQDLGFASPATLRPDGTFYKH